MTRRCLAGWLLSLITLCPSAWAAVTPPAPPPPPFSDEGKMSPDSPATHPELRGVSVTWLGHAAFQFVPAKGPRVVIDPFGAMVGSYPWSNPRANVVLVTHEHPDHNAVGRVQGRPAVVRGPGMHRAGGGTFLGVSAFHDNQGGKQRGPDTVFVFTLERVRFCHLGDLGQAALTPQQLRQIGSVDVLFVPVGGFYTIDAKAADRIIAQIKPRIVVPMHYKTRYTDPKNPIAGVDGFLRGKRNVQRLKGNTDTFSWVDAKKTPFPAKPSYVVFEPPTP